MNHNETCFCAKRTVEFRSDFESDVVAKIYCPACVERAPEEAVIFELCDPGEFAGLWGVVYNKGELKRLDPHYRETDDYFYSLLISGVCGPAIAREYKKTGLCRIFGFKHGADAQRAESTLNRPQEALAEEEGAKRRSAKKRPAKKTKKRR
jgi:hypothetical protein